MLNPLKKVAPFLFTLIFTAPVSAQLIFPLTPDIRDSRVEEIDLQIYVTESTFSPPLSTSFKLAISCKSHKLWDIFHLSGTTTFQRTFLCPSQKTEGYPQPCHTVISTKELIDSLSSPECEALIETAEDKYFFSPAVYRDSVNEGINFPLNFPNVGGLDFIDLTLNKAKQLEMNEPQDEGTEQ